jgi:phosphatidylglycerophosphate synthase
MGPPLIVQQEVVNLRGVLLAILREVLVAYMRATVIEDRDEHYR